MPTYLIYKYLFFAFRIMVGSYFLAELVIFFFVSLTLVQSAIKL